ncbi:MAG TPA: DegQ family serine endoprotease [Candidatus Margulisiibacteriota bacterium]|nr:DegQ family serine endoprotease [Candidatus Margulisiibacteriota bacterium]
MHRRLHLFLLALLLSTTTPLHARSAVAAAMVPESFSDVARTAKPTVVNIFSTRIVRPQGPLGDPNDPFNEFFRHFFGEMQPQRQQSLGSGFVVSKDGYIVTNAHVVQMADQIRVRLSNREEYDAKLVGVDEKTDVALVKISPRHELPVARLGDSDTLDVGDWVVAIGNPFGFAQTVTAGIVSAKGRVIGAGPYDDFIQTDASINPGNSGGPLLNTQGEVVGINSAIVSRSGGSVGIGFAIPVNTARRVIDELRQHGRVTRGWLGLSVQDVTPAIAQSFGLDHPQGALVVEVDPGGPADTAGLERGDIITDYNGTRIEESHQLPTLAANTPIGERAVMTILRNGHEKTVTAVVAEQPSRRPTRAQRPHATRGWGLTLTDLTPALMRQFSIPSGVRGAMIREIEDGSPADEAGLQAGDVIRQVDRQPVTSARTCDQALARVGDRVLLLIQRGPYVGYEVLNR